MYLTAMSCLLFALLLPLFPTFIYLSAASDDDFLSQDYIDRLNEEKLPWQAGKNFNEAVSCEDVLNLISKETSVTEKLSNTAYDYDFLENNVNVPLSFPKEFDARLRWPECKSIRYVYNQGNCESGWAIAPVSTFADRLCIASAGNFTSPLSAGYVLSCCSLCGRGCDGGWDDSAWHFIQKQGIPTGGLYGSNEGCYPYPIPPCEHRPTVKRKRGCPKRLSKTPYCHLLCPNPMYSQKCKDHLQKVNQINFIKPGEVGLSKLQLMIAGPIEAFFEVYTDFFSYKKGVYQVSKNAKIVGSHAVKIIGWGLENDLEYWLVVNSWGTNWGDKGLCKIRILKNGANFESKFIAGFPLIK